MLASTTYRVPRTPSPPRARPARPPPRPSPAWPRLSTSHHPPNRPAQPATRVGVSWIVGIPRRSSSALSANAPAVSLRFRARVCTHSWPLVFGGGGGGAVPCAEASPGGDLRNSAHVWGQCCAKRLRGSFASCTQGRACCILWGEHMPVRNDPNSHGTCAMRHWATHVLSPRTPQIVRQHVHGLHVGRPTGVLERSGGEAMRIKKIM